MSIIGKSYIFGEFAYQVQAVTGDPARVRVAILKDNAPYTDLLGRPVFRLFSAKAKEERVRAFCERFATDAGFRNSVLVADTLACC